MFHKISKSIYIQLKHVFADNHNLTFEHFFPQRQDKG